MHSQANKWLGFSFVNLLLVAFMGVILRYKILSPCHLLIKNIYSMGTPISHLPDGSPKH